MTNSTNPLAKHFRQPILYVKLPSRGRWYPEGAITLPASGDVPIYAMTARDEITLKTPDALLNGSSTVQVIESCCPVIADAWQVPSVDLDTLLIAIRIATYGTQMDFSCNCPYCQAPNEHGLDLQYMLDRNGQADWSRPVTIDNLTIALKPQSYQEFNQVSRDNFDEQRLLGLLENDQLSDDERSQKFNELFHKLIETGVDQVNRSIDSITTADGVVVTDREHIREFLSNCDKRVWDSIKQGLDNIRKQNVFNEVTVTCTEPTCNKEFTTPFVFEQSSFFA